MTWKPVHFLLETLSAVKLDTNALRRDDQKHSLWIINPILINIETKESFQLLHFKSQYHM